ncbi:sugar-binding domain-containing protein [Maribellus sediminis]|uniref:sugar-binding domain-containing protein n=1 Tax=Maribellus sediminis TaxID=2696285 RepID=UPI0014314F4E
MDLSGKWGFRIDIANVGVQEHCYTQAFGESVVLPGTTDENQKGQKSDKIEWYTLTRKYMFEGKAWYQREVDIPENWKTKRIHLFLERTKATEVWMMKSLSRFIG